MKRRRNRLLVDEMSDIDRRLCNMSDYIYTHIHGGKQYMELISLLLWRIEGSSTKATPSNFAIIQNEMVRF